MLNNKYLIINILFNASALGATSPKTGEIRMRLDYKGKYLFAFSDTHGMHRELSIPKGTDILICAGDVVSDFQENGLNDFFDWFSSCPAQLRLFVPGNHEIIFDLCPEEAHQLIPANVTLFEDCGIKYDGITSYAISSRMIQ